MHIIKLRSTNPDDVELGKFFYKELFEVSGFRLRKPIEVYAWKDELVEPPYTHFMAHDLPSDDNNGTGTALTGRGVSNPGAEIDFGRQLALRYANPLNEIEGQYLRSIMTSKRRF